MKRTERIGIKEIRAAARLLLNTASDHRNIPGVDLGVRCLRDLLITTVRLRREHMKAGTQ